MIGKWKLRRAGGWNPDDPRAPDPSLGDSVPAVDPSRSIPDAPALTPSALSPSGAGDAPTPASDDDLAYLRRVLAARPEAVCEHGLGASTSLARVWSTVESALAALTAARTARDRAEQEREALREVDAAQTALLACYRTGNHRRADAALTRLEAARAKLAALSATDSLAGAPVLAVDKATQSPTSRSIPEGAVDSALTPPEPPHV